MKGSNPDCVNGLRHGVLLHIHDTLHMGHCVLLHIITFI